MKRIVISLTYLLFAWLMVQAQTLKPLPSYSQLRSCDLLFCVNPKGNAITDVTQGADGMQIDHVGIYHRGKVIEAAPDRGVCLTPIDSFVRRNQYLIIMGRVGISFSKRKTIRHAKECIGLPYDSLYLPDLKAVYCSELVLYSFRDKHDEKVFQPIGMTFRDSTGEIPSYWKDFYRQFGMQVPEGVEGSNPGELSRRPCVKLLYKTF